ncbi:MAG: EAL domain-containing protein [Clostridiales bacterium]|nr:EAL domain-containing protein [Clostridiales bacterium]
MDGEQGKENKKEKHEASSFIERFIDSSLHPEKDVRNATLWIVIYVVAFSVFAVINPIVAMTPKLQFLHAFRGFLTLIQLLLSVLIVQMLNRKGFRAVLVVTILQCCMTMINIIRFNDQYAVNGLATTALGLLIVCIILGYNLRIAREVEKVERKTEDLEKANAELKIREEKTKRQNSLLTEYNRVMKENEERLYQMNHFDTLTGLPNRIKITARMDLLISLLSHKNMSFALVYIDLDNFKKINDTIGHRVGDLMLQAVSTRLATIISDEDMLGRWGGDEFAILIQRPLDANSILSYVESIRDSFHQMFNLEDSDYKMSASFGIALFPQDGETSSELIKCAETAMYKAKEYGKNMVQFYSKEMKDEIMRRIKYEGQLLSAIENQELYLCYQPQYDTLTKKLRGFEALCRWKNEKFGEVTPMEFIPVAETIGFIVPLGEWVMETACKTLKTYSEKYNWDGTMSINISAVQLMAPQFMQSVKRILSKTQVDPRKLEFEVTESVMVANLDHAVTILKEIASLGISIALDDFGTGYSSMNYLRQLPICVLKIDKSFIDELPSKDTQRLMVGSIISLVHQMNMVTIAEGVDEERKVELLAKYECDYIQGFLWGRPVPESELDALFKENL